jgi:hypothetical protein
LSKYSYLIQNSLTMLVPAAIYLAMNILGFLSLQYIDAATFAIIAQVQLAPHAREDSVVAPMLPPRRVLMHPSELSLPARFLLAFR